jgi:hypothetical protein
MAPRAQQGGGGCVVWDDLNMTNKPPCLIIDIDVGERDHDANKQGPHPK